VIAEANGVDDPMRLAPGRQLLLPALDELARLRDDGTDAARRRGGVS
jgi:hypothetical protein